MNYIVMLVSTLMLVSTSAIADLNDDIKSMPSTSTASDPAVAPAPAPAQKEPSLLEKVAKFEKGKTTLAEVIKILGQPIRIMTMPDETKHVTYSNIAASRNAASYVPVVGMFAGGTNVKGESATLIFDKHDVLQSTMTSQL